MRPRPSVPDYERFAPQDPLGRPDQVDGIREFVVGTGGWSWRFVHAGGASVSD